MTNIENYYIPLVLLVLFLILLQIRYSRATSWLKDWARKNGCIVSFSRWIWWRNYEAFDITLEDGRSGRLTFPHHLGYGETPPAKMEWDDENTA